MVPPLPSSKELVLAIPSSHMLAEWKDSKLYSSWVLQNIKGISQLLGITYYGFDDRALALFAELEERNCKNIDVSCQCNKGKKRQHEMGSRELKCL